MFPVEQQCYSNLSLALDTCLSEEENLVRIAFQMMTKAIINFICEKQTLLVDREYNHNLGLVYAKIV